MSGWLVPPLKSTSRQNVSSKFGLMILDKDDVENGRGNSWIFPWLFLDQVHGTKMFVKSPQNEKSSFNVQY